MQLKLCCCAEYAAGWYTGWNCFSSSVDQRPALQNSCRSRDADLDTPSPSSSIHSSTSRHSRLFYLAADPIFAERPLVCSLSLCLRYSFICLSLRFKHICNSTLNSCLPVNTLVWICPVLQQKFNGANVVTISSPHQQVERLEFTTPVVVEAQHATVPKHVMFWY